MKWKTYLPLILILPVLFLDIGTKMIAFHTLPHPGTNEAIEMQMQSQTNPDDWVPLRFNLVWNHGAIFGFFSDVDSPVFKQVVLSLFTLIALIVVGLFYRALKKELLYPRILIAIIMGGALGNFFDRILGYIIYEGKFQFMWGKVVDFIDMGVGPYYGKWEFLGMSLSYRWPTYNIADAEILLAVILLVIYLMRKQKEDVFISKNQQASQPTKPTSKNSK